MNIEEHRNFCLSLGDGIEENFRVAFPNFPYIGPDKNIKP